MLKRNNVWEYCEGLLQACISSTFIIFTLLLANKVNTYNEKLENLCLERNWGLIKHDNITKVHLNNYGLHLNQRGTATLAGNFQIDIWCGQE